jgi:hypothetical protein
MVGDERNYVGLIVNDENQLSARRSGLHGLKPENHRMCGQPTNVTIEPRFPASQVTHLRGTLQALKTMVKPH